MKRQTQNPYLPGWEYVPDGEPKLFDGRVYVYGSHDEARGKTYCTGDYVCWSAPEDDLASWTFEGVIYRKSDDPNYDEKVLLFAPDVAQGPDGRYYLYYFSMRMEKIGVAVCESPAGHYRYLGDVRFEDGTVLSPECGYGLPFDPVVLSEESGNWVYYGFAMQKRVKGLPEAAYMGGYVARLADDMLTICGLPAPTIPGRLQASGTGYEGHAFLEASSIRHYGDKYYLVYSSELGHELCYAVSDKPDGAFIYQETIVSNGDVGLDGRTEKEAVYYLGNNHGGLVRIKDKMYIFYHRHTHGIQYSRQGCIEPVFMDRDGMIAQVEITSSGAGGKPWRAEGEYSSHLACCLRSKEGILHYSSSVKWNDAHPFISQESEDGAASLQNQFVHNLKDGAVCGFKYLEFEGQEKKIEICVRGTFNGIVKVLLDNPEGEKAAEVEIKPESIWNWRSARLAHVRGIHGLYFQMEGTGACDMDCFRIVR